MAGTKASAAAVVTAQKFKCAVKHSKLSGFGKVMKVQVVVKPESGPMKSVLVEIRKAATVGQLRECLAHSNYDTKELEAYVAGNESHGAELRDEQVLRTSALKDAYEAVKGRQGFFKKGAATIVFRVPAVPSRRTAPRRTPQLVTPSSHVLSSSTGQGGTINAELFYQLGPSVITCDIPILRTDTSKDICVKIAKSQHLPIGLVLLMCQPLVQYTGDSPRPSSAVTLTYKGIKYGGGNGSVLAKLQDDDGGVHYTPLGRGALQCADVVLLQLSFPEQKVRVHFAGVEQVVNCRPNISLGQLKALLVQGNPNKAEVKLANVGLDESNIVLDVQERIRFVMPADADADAEVAEPEETKVAVEKVPLRLAPSFAVAVAAAARKRHVAQSPTASTVGRALPCYISSDPSGELQIRFTVERPGAITSAAFLSSSNTEPARFRIGATTTATQAFEKMLDKLNHRRGAQEYSEDQLKMGFPKLVGRGWQHESKAFFDDDHLPAM